MQPLAKFLDLIFEDFVSKILLSMPRSVGLRMLQFRNSSADRFES